MIDMVQVLDNHYFWLTLAWLFSGMLAFGAGFFTCFYFFNYNVVKSEEVITEDMEKHLEKTDFWTKLLKRHEKED